jgi:hypothetical protein
MKKMFLLASIVIFANIANAQMAVTLPVPDTLASFLTPMREDTVKSNWVFSYKEDSLFIQRDTLGYFSIVIKNKERIRLTSLVWMKFRMKDEWRTTSDYKDTTYFPTLLTDAKNIIKNSK